MARVRYEKIAAVVLPPALFVIGLLVFLRFQQAEPICPPAAEAGSAPAPAPSATSDTKEVFDSVYRERVWGRGSGSEGTSGAGSTLAATVVYRAFLEQFMKANNIKSVVDAGCGDWEFSQAMDWTGIDYKGYDIVDSVIAADRQKYGKPNIQFFTANIVETDLPKADLLICKEVLQHLPNADIAKFLTQLPKYKHVLITNGVAPVTLTTRNIDMTLEDAKAGGYRNIDITKPPFNIRGVKLLTYSANQAMHQVVHVGPPTLP